jgi:DNA-binding PadR family transcriptional regulator
LLKNYDVLILNILFKGSNYGYGIAREIDVNSKGTLDCKEGTLYPVLHKMELDDLITGKWEEINGKRRKYYKITKKGERRLKEGVEMIKILHSFLGSTNLIQLN